MIDQDIAQGPHQPSLAGFWADRVFLTLVQNLAVAVPTPLTYIAEHIVEPEGLGHRSGHRTSPPYPLADAAVS